METEPAGFQPIDNVSNAAQQAGGQLPPPPPTASPWGSPLPMQEFPAAPQPRRRSILGLPAWAAGLIVVGSLLAVVIGIAMVSGDDSSDSASSSKFVYAESLPKPTDGIPFDDPQGTYSIEIGPDWEPMTMTVVKEIEQWAVAEQGSDPLVPNINVLTQNAPGMDLQEYIDLSLANMGDFEVLGAATVEVDGHEIGVMEYKGLIPGTSMRAHVLAVFDVGGGQAVVATLATTERRFAEIREEVEPYMRTLVVS